MIKLIFDPYIATYQGCIWSHPAMCVVSYVRVITWPHQCNPKGGDIKVSVKCLAMHAYFTAAQI